MCGIVGIYSHKKQVDRRALRQAVKILNHRGPDNQHLWHSKNNHVGLGHARLSIIDLKHGDQPLTNINKSIYLVVNGEFYDFKRITTLLKKKGHRFLTHSDSEIALHLYEEYGAHCLNYLRGEFAFILWDSNNELFFAARDRFGIKPLFYTYYQDKLYLASEIKALFAAGVPAIWDEESILLVSASTLNLSNKTPFKNIYQIPPGHYLLALKDYIQIIKYWDFDYPVLEEQSPIVSTKTYIKELRSLLEEAVRLRLQADVPVACYLSGGLDSSVVLGLAAAQSTRNIPAFTLSFTEKAYDEERIAREMAAKTGSNYFPIYIKESDLASNFSDAVWHGETFFYNGHAVAKFLLSKAVHEAGYKVVLTGEGSDELFAGYAHFRVDHLLYGGFKEKEKKTLLAKLKASNFVSQGFLIPDKTSDIPCVKSILGFTPAWLQVAMESGNRLIPFLKNDFYHKRKLNSFKIVFNSLDITKQLKKRDPVHQSMYLWSKFRLPDYILTILGDRMEMAHSVEGRVPFLDHHVVEFMRNVPVELKIKNMTEKYLLREACKHVLTKTVYERQKHPFLAPPALLDRKSPFFELIQTTLRGPLLRSVPFYDQKKVVRFLDNIDKLDYKDAPNWDPILTTILSTCMLQDRFKIKT